jgi:protease II
MAVLETENRRNEDTMAQTTDLQNARYRDLTDWIHQPDTGVPTTWRDFLYHNKLKRFGVEPLSAADRTPPTLDREAALIYASC